MKASTARFLAIALLLCGVGSASAQSRPPNPFDSGYQSPRQTVTRQAQQASLGSLSLAAAKDPDQILRDMRRMAIVSHTPWLASEALLAGLEKSRVLEALGVVASQNQPGTTVEMIVTRSGQNLLWHYSLLDIAGGTELASGTVRGVTAETAVPRLAAALERRLTALHPEITLPAAPKGTSPDLESLIQRLGICKVRIAGGDVGVEMGSDLELVFGDDRILGRSPEGHTVFSIPIDQLSDVAIEHSRHAPLSEFAGNVAGEVWDASGDAGEGAALGVALSIATVAVSVMLEPIRTTQHFVSVAWTERKADRVVVLQVPKNKAQPLVEILRAMLDESDNSATSLAATGPAK